MPRRFSGLLVVSALALAAFTPPAAAHRPWPAAVSPQLVRFHHLTWYCFHGDLGDPSTITVHECTRAITGHAAPQPVRGRH